MDQNDTLRNLLIAVGVFFLIVWALPRLLPPGPTQTPTPTADQTGRATEPPGDTSHPYSEPIRTTGETSQTDERPPGQPVTGEPDGGFVVVWRGDEIVTEKISNIPVK